MLPRYRSLVLLAAPVILFLGLAFFWTPRLTRDQRQILYFLFTLGAAATAGLLGWFNVAFGRRTAIRGTVSGGGGMAVFVLTYLVRPYWYVATPDVRADVIVAHLKERVGAPEVEIPLRIVADLQKTIASTSLNRLSVDVYPRPITSASDAEQAAIDSNAKLVIWGWSDRLGIHVSIHTRGEMKERAPLGDIEWQAANGLGRDLLLEVKNAVIPNVSFISMFALGSLYYTGQNYAAGHASFDAAMRNIPSEAHLANPGLLSFFQARALQTRADASKDDVVCLYSEAIRNDSLLYEAYVNLGVLELGSGYPTFRQKLSERGDDCYEKVQATFGDGETSFFDAALRIEPRSTVAAYDRIASRWLQGEFGEYSYVQAQSDVAALLRKDPSIPGAHMLAAIIAFDRNELADAEQHFKKAVELSPSFFFARIDLSKVEYLRGNVAAAKNDLSFALRRTPGDPEASIALATIALRERQPAEALSVLDRISVPSKETAEAEHTSETRAIAPAYASLLRICALDAQGNRKEAARRAEVLFAEGVRLESEPDDFETGDRDKTKHGPATSLAGFVALIAREEAGLPADWKKFDSNADTDSSSMPEPSNGPAPDGASDFEAETRSNPDIADLWTEIVKKCGGDKAGHPSRWGPVSSCLPRSADDRMKVVCGLASDQIMTRLYGRKEVPVGLACPHLFTRNGPDRAWRWQGAVLVGLHGRRLETAQQFVLPPGPIPRELLIRELEDETSFINSVRLQWTGPDGRKVVLAPKDERIAFDDEDYVELRRGQALRISFLEADRLPQGRVSVLVRGFYRRWHLSDLR